MTAIMKATTIAFRALRFNTGESVNSRREYPRGDAAGVLVINHAHKRIIGKHIDANIGRCK